MLPPALKCVVFALLVALGDRAWAEDMPAPVPTAEAIEYFETNVRPLLAEHCISCHGAEKQKAGLRLDSRDAFLKGGEHGPPAKAGDPGNSLMVHALRQDGELKMPPSGKLDDAKVTLVEQWIAMGAAWPEGAAAPIVPRGMDARIAEARAKHWAFQPVRDVPPPPVQHAEFVANAVDNFIETKLESDGRTMSPRTDKRTLLRRAYYDLTGLPPTPQQVQDFETDTAPDAFEKVVDGLLASPRYGERWGRIWLDVARYSDTKGYVFQEDRNYPYSYTYRDYVIRAFNEDLPFDQFVRHQLAADMMDLGSDKRPLAALGFLTLGRRFINNIHDITDDRIDVTSRGFLGLTVTCARCHEHKYDPIPAEDYYSLYGIFRSASEPPEYPIIAERPADDPLYQDYKKALAEKQKNLDDYLTDEHVKLLNHAREKVGEYLLAAHDARDKDDEGLKTIAKDRKLKWPFVQRWRDFLKAKAALSPPDPFWSAFCKFDVLPAEGFEAAAVELAKAVAENKDPAGPLNPRIAEAFGGEAPKTMDGVVERYRKVMGDAESAWKDLLAARVQIAQQKSAAPEIPAALPDANLEPARLALYGADSPANMSLADMEALGDVPLRDGIRNRRNQIAEVKATHPGRPDGAMSLADAPKPFDPYVFLRGKPDSHGPDVKRQFLAVLSAPERKPFEHGSGRLELADAIASKDNPLTARVFVNRVWAQHFGKPLVNTPSDFGVRCDLPTHPELLDYLARYFMDHDWSVKALQRLIVTSYAFQQDSAETAAGHAADPENKTLWRQNRRRLDFEGLRDSVLTASGALDFTMGGPSVSITDAPFTKRRTVYSFIDRQNLPGVFRTFDFASPDAHSPRRFQTTVPQQALFMMNSPFVVEQARALAARPEIAQAGDAAGDVKSLYTTLYQREPAPDELALGERFLGEAKAEPATSSDWQYGYGTLDPATNTITQFTAFPYFGEGAWKGGTALPDATLGWVNLTSGGGHPGHDLQHVAVRRWGAPMDGTVSINAELAHGGECGDGIDGLIVSSAAGPLWHEHVKYAKANAALPTVAVRAGEIVDFIVSPGADENCDSFTFAPSIKYAASETTASLGTTQRTEWNSITDFAGPMPPPLQPLEQYAQVLLLSNEFAFVD